MLTSSYTDAEDTLKLLPECPTYVRAKLEDIATNIEFDNELRVFHPNYQSFEPEQEVRDRFLKLPEEAQQKQTLKHLRSFLYSAYYNGSLERAAEHPRQANLLTLNHQRMRVLSELTLNCFRSLMTIIQGAAILNRVG